MKKLSVLFIISISLILTFSSFASSSFENTITTLELTQDQRDIAGLLSAINATEMQVFEFNMEKEYSMLEFWVEIYENGEFIECPVKVSTNFKNDQKHNGRMGLIIDRSLRYQYQWALSVIENDIRTSQVSKMKTFIDLPIVGISGAEDTPLKIEDGREIILYKTLISHTSSVSSDVDLQEHPELLKEYLYAHLVKCKFSI